MKKKRKKEDILGFSKRHSVLRKYTESWETLWMYVRLFTLPFMNFGNNTLRNLISCGEKIKPNISMTKILRLKSYFESLLGGDTLMMVELVVISLAL